MEVYREHSEISNKPQLLSFQCAVELISYLRESIRIINEKQRNNKLFRKCMKECSRARISSHNS